MQSAQGASASSIEGLEMEQWTILLGEPHPFRLAHNFRKNQQQGGSLDDGEYCEESAEIDGKRPFGEFFALELA
jgi:hypothetical protein